MNNSSNNNNHDESSGNNRHVSYLDDPAIAAAVTASPRPIRFQRNSMVPAADMWSISSPHGAATRSSHNADPSSSDVSESVKRAIGQDFLGVAGKRSRNSIVAVVDSEAHINTNNEPLIPSEYFDDEEMSLLGDGDDGDDDDSQEAKQHSMYGTNSGSDNLGFSDADDPLSPHQNHSRKKKQKDTAWTNFIQQASSVAVVCLLNIMCSIPFGASYFPVGWRAADDTNTDTDNLPESGDEIDGAFPLPDKAALGIRMFLFATIIGQIALTFSSKFANPTSLQMVENVPFLHALATTVIQEQGYGVEALSTLFFLFGLSSVVVGATFYALGRFELGRVVYFFPGHVLMGCIGGIGIFMIFTAIEVTNDLPFTYDMDGIRGFIHNIHLFGVVIFFESLLRFISWLMTDEKGQPKFQLLSPVFYCLITPMFYIGLLLFHIEMDQATEWGYFFPDVSGSESDNGGAGGLFGNDPHLFDIFTVINLRTVSWKAVFNSTGTMIALAAFSLIHVPINIPAFAVSTDVDTDMNAELMAHGYSNALSGIFGGLQNYMSYSISALYAKSGGKGKISSLAIAVITAIFFIVGPSIATYLPRCMAGTLLLHIGIDLFLEGLFDSYGEFDTLEYAGVWVIAIVMTLFGMTAALLVGVIAALSTYAVQSATFQNPIRDVMTANALTSSSWNRVQAALDILEEKDTGRSKVLIFQLQGHLFFGNVAQMTDSIKQLLAEKRTVGESPVAVVIDFTLVAGMDSSAAHAIAKLKNILHRLFHVDVSIFVTGSNRGGFPCEFALSRALSTVGMDNDVPYAQALTTYPIDHVCETLDDALVFAEDILIARVDPSLVMGTGGPSFDPSADAGCKIMTEQEELGLVRNTLIELCDHQQRDDAHLNDNVDVLLSLLQREVYSEHDRIWEQGDESTSAKILVSGTLISMIDNGISEVVKRGNLVGELGLVHGGNRLVSLECISEKAVLYSLSKESWNTLVNEKPQAARILDSIVIRYLAHRVQHVSNRYFGSTLPV